METKQTNYIINQLYAPEMFNGKKKGWLHSVFSLNTRSLTNNRRLVVIKQRLSLSKKAIIISSLTLAVIILVGIWHFNTFYFNLQNMLAAEGEVDVFMQRRHDLSINLATMVLDYSKHEQMVLGNVVQARKPLFGGPAHEELSKALESLKAGDKTPVIPGTADLLSKVFAVAEQYPDLKLTQNFQNFSNAIIEVEKDLSTARVKYNTMINAYTTPLGVFPGYAYNWVFGFQDHNYYQAHTDAKTFKPVAF